MAAIPVSVPSFEDEERLKISEHVNAIREIIAPKFINLEAADRQAYGSVSEQNKLVINKVGDYRENMPLLADPTVDWDKYAACTKTRKNYAMVAAMLNELNELCNDPRTMVDYTLYSMALEDYDHTKYMAGKSNNTVAGYEGKYDDLKQFFAKSSKSEPEAPEEK